MELDVVFLFRYTLLCLLDPQNTASLQICIFLHVGIFSNVHNIVVL